jgi:cytochrome P450 family 307 subfamily A
MAYLTFFLLPLAVIVIVVISYLKVLYDWWRQVNIVREKPNKNSTAVETYTVEKYPQAPGPTPWPILGSLALLGEYEVPFEAFTALAKKYGDIYSITLGATRCLVVNNLDRIREVLNQNGKYFGGRPDFLRFHKLFGGDRNNCKYKKYKFIFCNHLFRKRFLLLSTP